VEGATRFLNVTEISLSLAQTTVGYCMGCSETVQDRVEYGCSHLPAYIPVLTYAYACSIGGVCCANRIKFDLIVNLNVRIQVPQVWSDDVSSLP
jgi:hypothetical protein